MTVSFRFYEYNNVFLSKRFFSSFDQNFLFVSISNLFDIEGFIIEDG